MITYSDRKAILIADTFEGKPFTCTMLGERLFDGTRTRQAYARPAGKVLHRLKRKGYVREDYTYIGLLSEILEDPSTKRSCWRRTSKRLETY